ncbi:unnamed protein product, partial [Bemisia tabaci]
REQYLFNVFEVIVSTLESKLQRIENLDKAVEHLMRRVEALDSRVADNLDKTDSIIAKLRTLDVKLFQVMPGTISKVNTVNNGKDDYAEKIQVNTNLDMKLIALLAKVNNIDNKLASMKTQLDSNFVAADDINAEASEKKPVSMNMWELPKLLTSELDQIRGNTANVDRKLQYHINLVSENLQKMLNMVKDVHEAVVEQPASLPHRHKNGTTTTTQAPQPVLKGNKLDKLMNQMSPILSVSEKMDEVWDVVVGTKSSVDDLVPKSDELLTQTQRQERAISDIHADLRQKTNKIIANLDSVEKRLKKQEEDVVSLAQRPVAAELLLDPTIDRLVEYDASRYSADDVSLTEPPLPVTLTTPTSTISITSTVSPTTGFVVPTTKAPSRNRGVIFPSVKNKPSPANTTFATEIFPSIRDVKGFSCLDIWNAGMKTSGVYYLQIRGTTFWYLKVFCDQETADGGWTLIQRRDDFDDPRENFNRDWADYKNGFGDPTKEFWLGNENIYMLTNNEEYMLRVELEDFEGNKRYAQYSHFKIYSENDYYKLEIDGYEGNAGDSLNDPWYGSNNSPFSTYNRDNDRSSLNCASMLKGGWWWKSCGRGLNGLYLNDPQDLTARQGIVWFRWRGWDYTLKKSTMMIKPKVAGNSP